MKKALLISMLTASAIGLSAQNISPKLLGSPSINITNEDLRGEDEYVPADLPCPDNTYLAGEFDENKAGFQTSDEGRPDLYCKFYQSFSNCYWKIKSVRIVATFASYNADEGWHASSNRNIFEEGTDNIVRPLKMQVSFYEDNNGVPGKMVSQKIQDVLGVNTGFSQNGYPYGKLYTFTLNLDEPATLERGWVAVSAVDDGTKPEAWLALMTNSTVPGMGLIEIDDSKENKHFFMKAFGSMCYCMMGNGDMISQKALALNKITSPKLNGTSKNEKVQVEIRNVGSEVYENPELELWIDNKKVCSETIKTSIKSLESYRHTFSTNVDLSNGKHIVKVKNVTQGDEHLCPTSIAVEVEDYINGAKCTSGSETAGYAYITNFTCGDIENKSEHSKYSDFTNLKTTIKPGEVIEASATVSGYYGKYLTLWIDWNNNGTFDDDEEYIGYIGKDPLKISIPKNVSVSEGNHTMRVIFSDQMVSPCSTYEYGETEDYTLVVKRDDNSPSVSIDKKEASIYISEDDQTKSSLNLKNNGSKDINATLEVEYFLPNMPFSANSCRSQKDLTTPQSSNPFVLKNSLRAYEPTKDEQTTFTLHFDKGAQTAFSSGGNTTFTGTQYYPAKMLKDVEGLKITSADVFFYDAPKKASIVMYKGINQSTTEEKPFFTQEINSVSSLAWNHIVFDKPIEIKGEDTWLGVKMEDLEDGKFFLGIDKGPSLIGYGAMVSVGKGKWVPFTELGLDANYCMRFNLEGDRTPAINWLSISEEKFDIAPNQEKEIKLEATLEGLNTAVCEAILKIKTNDPLNGLIEVPVYLYTVKGASINPIETKQGEIKIIPSDKKIEVTSDKRIVRIDMINMNGQLVQSSKYNSPSVSMYFRSIINGSYIFVVYYEDGQIESVKYVW